MSVVVEQGNLSRAGLSQSVWATRLWQGLETQRAGWWHKANNNVIGHRSQISKKGQSIKSNLSPDPICHLTPDVPVTAAWLCLFLIKTTSQFLHEYIG